MEPYEPIDLSSYCNAPATVLGDEPLPLGEQILHGLPFLIGPAQQGGSCLIEVGQSASPPTDIEIGRPAHTITFAHALLESAIEQGGSVGEEFGTYEFHLDNNEVIQVPLRERFEISTAPPGKDTPFLAHADHSDSLFPRHEGPWEQAGRRQTEGDRGRSKWFVLWSWRNPTPEKRVLRVRVSAASTRSFVIGGVTLGLTAEDPICRDGLRDVRITLPRDEDGNKPFDLQVNVDRGVATYPYPLPQQSTAEFLKDDRAGWGEAQNELSSPSQVEIAGSPSATVSVEHDGEQVGAVNWGEVLDKGFAESDDGRVKVEIVDHGRNWVHTTIVDDDTGKPVPCRVHFRSPEGVAYAPHGHHAHVNSNMGSWHVDVGGDVRLGQITYAYTDGTCQGWLPRGEVIVEVARGFEYEPLRAKVELKPGQRELELRLKRWCHMNKERWFSGDSHVHFLSRQGSHMEANGEDLNVVNMLQSQWGGMFSDAQEFTGEASVSNDGKSIVYVSQENRQHFLGHLILWGLKEPVMPWCSDGLSEAEPGGSLEVTMSDWADQTHAQGGTVVIPHLPGPNGEPATLIATGRADAIEMLRHGPYEHNEWYRYLNCGYKLPLVGGTDKMSNDVPVGIYRTYTHIPDDEPFTYDSWCRNVAAGRTFHSGGPMMRFSVDGREIGDTIELPGNGGTVEVVAEAESTLPIHTLQIVKEGEVVASTEEAAGARKLSLRTDVSVDGHSWLAARCGGPEYTSVPHYDSWARGIFAHTSPIYIACGGEWWMYNADTAQYMLTLVDGCIQYMRNTSRQLPEGEALHHHGEDDHMEYLERPFRQAIEAIHKRMHKHGIPH